MRASSENKAKVKKFLTAFAATVFWVAVWAVVSIFVGKEVILPSPLSVLRSLFSLAGTAVFWGSAGLSVLRIVTGFAVGALAGIVFAFLSHFSATVRALLSPVVYVVRATPVASFIIIAIVWLAVGTIPTFISSLMVFPIVYGAVCAALDGGDRGLYEVTVLYSWSPLRRLKDYYIPTVSGALAASLTTSFGLAWKAGVAAEVLCLPKLSIGKHLYESKLYLESSELFAWTAVVIIISIALERLVVHLGKVVKRR